MVITFGDLATNDIFNTTSGMAWYRHTYMYVKKKLADFNLAVKMHTAKPPNFNPAKFSCYTVSI